MNYLQRVSSPFICVVVLALLAGCGGDTEPATNAPSVVSGAGDEAATKVEEYRQLLGGINNGGNPGSQGATGYREVNWDSVPDERSAPNPYPADFFNAKESPRARGLVLSTPGTALMVSADSANPTGTLPRFGNINPKYPNSFSAFSEERLFSPVGSNVAEVTFFVPGTDTPAVVRGFGAIYTDIDTDHTAFEYFDIDGKSLGKYGAPIVDNGLSFLGVVFREAVIHRVRVAYGTDALGPDDGGGIDVAVMDNFIYGEPQPAK